MKFCWSKEIKKGAPESGFEPESEPRQLREIGSLVKAQKDNISVAERRSPQQETLATLEFKSTKKGLNSFLAWRTAGLAYKSSVSIIKAGEVFWKEIKGTISKTSLDQFVRFSSRSTMISTPRARC